MSLLVRAAMLGGLAYVVSRALKTSRDSKYLLHADAQRRLPRTLQGDEPRPTSELSSTSTL